MFLFLLIHIHQQKMYRSIFEPTTLRQFPNNIFQLIITVVNILRHEYLVKKWYTWIHLFLNKVQLYFAIWTIVFLKIFFCLMFIKRKKLRKNNWRLNLNQTFNIWFPDPLTKTQKKYLLTQKVDFWIHSLANKKKSK